MRALEIDDDVQGKFFDGNSIEMGVEVVEMG